jgi:8-oxo-dGTP diphosphatase
VAEPSPPVPAVAVGLIARDQAGRLLLIRRGKPPARGTWSVPGGRVEPGETLAQAAVRELAEETGLTARVGAVAGVVERIGEGFHYVIVDLFAELDDVAALAAASDADDARLAAPDELAGIDLTPGLAEFLASVGCWPDDVPVPDNPWVPS